jgi:hypothetical protein
MQAQLEQFKLVEKGKAVVNHERVDNEDAGAGSIGARAAVRS